MVIKGSEWMEVRGDAQSETGEKSLYIETGVIVITVILDLSV